MTQLDSDRLQRIETSLETLMHELMGNGQPGWCAVQSKRLDLLETWRAYVAGALAVVGFLATAAIAIGCVILTKEMK